MDNFTLETLYKLDALHERDARVIAIIKELGELMKAEPIDWPKVEMLTREMRRLVGLPEVTE